MDEPQSVGTEIGTNLVPHLLSISKSMRQLLSIRLIECGVEAGQDQFLMCFADGEAVSVAGLADRLSVRPSTVSKMTDILERQGWVVRKRDCDDARRVLVRLTATGLKVRDAVRAVEADMNAELTKELGPDEAVVPCLSKLDAVITRRLRRLR